MQKQARSWWKKRYPCNPLWAQLSDLYGAIGDPAKSARTVVTASPDKRELLSSTLLFASYFLRSGVVRKRDDLAPCPEEDVRKATEDASEQQQQQQQDQPPPLSMSWMGTGRRRRLKRSETIDKRLDDDDDACQKNEDKHPNNARIKIIVDAISSTRREASAVSYLQLQCKSLVALG